MSEGERVELSEFTSKKKKAEAAKGTLHRIEILRALPVERTIAITGAVK